MEKFLFVFVHLGLPILVLLAMLFVNPKSRIGKFSTLICSSSLLIFLYFWGQWPIAFSTYFKYVLPVILILCIVQYLRKCNRPSNWWPKGIWGSIRTSVTLLFALLFTYLCVQVLKGRHYPQQESMSLEFPLKDGKYYVALGGSNRTINNHYGTSFQAQQYALDFNKLSVMGSVARPIWSDKNEDHLIFGETIYCPCNGLVVEAKAYVEDNAGASMDVSAEDGMGNYISIDCDGTIVTMVHLKQNSLKVKNGEQVSAGDALAQVGNSGFSQEPHLHLQAASYNQDSVLVGLPMKFNARQLVRNDVYKN